MNSEIKESIKDSYDSTMMSYYQSDEYKELYQQREDAISDLESTLSDDQISSLHKADEAFMKLHSHIALEAYYRGVVEGIAVRKDVIT